MKELVNTRFIYTTHVISKALIGLTLFCFILNPVHAQNKYRNGKKISPDLFGLFFEDINYAADGGLYAELIQNRSFEYNPTERKEWHPLYNWDYFTTGYSYGNVNIETSQPVHPNNPHYIILEAEHIYQQDGSVGIKNQGFDGIVVKAGNLYQFSVFAKQLSIEPVTLKISLQNRKGEVLAEQNLTVSSIQWGKQTAVLQPSADYDTASLVIALVSKGKIALDVVSLFPEETFKKRPNGMRADLAQLLAEMKPAFIRFPGGCLVHGDGLGNMYRWKNTIGPIEQRVEQRNIWGYHQTGGLGYYEYFQFCEDIGAKPLPVLPAAVSCQNSGGTWRIGGTGQRALPLEDMQDYIQEVLDLIEWANGPVNSTWGSKRAAAGHPASFNLQYIGIGNEEKITPEFEQRFKLVHDAVKARYPEITVIGTSGPFHSGEDFEKGWAFAKNQQVKVVDEHYYVQPEWFISNQYRYDNYPRSSGNVYLGEYASWGNQLKNALAEAAFMTGLERNGDVVQLASYAPLFAKKNNTQWKTDMIFFDNTRYYLTPNYHVQKLFSVNKGDRYLNNIIQKEDRDTSIAASATGDSRTGDIILKLVNTGKDKKTIATDLTGYKFSSDGVKILLSGTADQQNSFSDPDAVKPDQGPIAIKKKMNIELPPLSLMVIRIKTLK
ncbi:MAG TPA: alpha-L-arabinofuranosidase C-terminal domain-containing protein [Chitinophagaceae bacterium]|nr:alpha-L-arabinofuranosidase C-terminal domain-containing protein [Chitinophagaceae bacterium]